MTKKYIEIPVLNNEYKVIVCWGSSKEVVKVLKDWNYPDPADSVTACCWDSKRGMCFSERSCHPVIALPRFPRTSAEIGTLSHEAVHAVHHIFEMINEPLTGEVFAHSVGAIVREALQVTKKGGKKKK